MNLTSKAKQAIGDAARTVHGVASSGGAMAGSLIGGGIPYYGGKAIGAMGKAAMNDPLAAGLIGAGVFGAGLAANAMMSGGSPEASVAQLAAQSQQISEAVRSGQMTPEEGLVAQEALVEQAEAMGQALRDPNSLGGRELALEMQMARDMGRINDQVAGSLGDYVNAIDRGILTQSPEMAMATQQALQQQALQNMAIGNAMNQTLATEGTRQMLAEQRMREQMGYQGAMGAADNAAKINAAATNALIGSFI